MCYLVTGINTALASSNSAVRIHRIFDTEQEAKEGAESVLKAGHTEVAVWKQVATPKMEQVISWGENNG